MEILHRTPSVAKTGLVQTTNEITEKIIREVLRTYGCIGRVRYAEPTGKKANVSTLYIGENFEMSCTTVSGITLDFKMSNLLKKKDYYKKQAWLLFVESARKATARCQANNRCPSVALCVNFPLNTLIFEEQVLLILSSLLTFRKRNLFPYLGGHVKAATFKKKKCVLIGHGGKIFVLIHLRGHF